MIKSYIMKEFALILLALVSLFSCGRQEKEGKPNIILLFADDQCYQTIRELGNQEVITPNLDDLARRGTVFTNAYNMGGWHGAICVASRTMFNTGRFLWRANEMENQLDVLASRGEFWSLEMEKLGYETYFTGKWHVNIPPPRVFNHVGTVRGGMPRAAPETYNRPMDESDTTWTPWDTAFGGFWEGGTHWSEVVANETLVFLDSATRSEKPFFMYVAFNAPHDPRQSPREYVDLYPLDQVAIPENALPMYPYKDLIGCEPGLRDERLAPFPRTPYAVKVHRQEYYAIISHMDAQVGRIVRKLKATGLDKNTYLFFTADHGLSVGQHGFMGKQNMYDHSLRPPLIVVGPEIPGGVRKHMEVYLQDIMPTAIEYAGGKVPVYVEFKSLKKAIEGTMNAGAYSQGIYAAYRDLQRMIRVNEFKLVVYPVAGVRRLYNLAEDPMEMNDLAASPEYSGRLDDMFEQLRDLMVEMGDTLELGEFSFGPLF